MLIFACNDWTSTVPPSRIHFQILGVGTFVPVIRNGSPVEVLVIRAVRSPNLWCVPWCVSRNASVRGIDQFGGKACVSPGRTAQVRHGSKRIPIFPTARLGFSRPQACGFEKPSLAVGKMQTPYAGLLLSINLLWGTDLDVRIGRLKSIPQLEM